MTLLVKQQEGIWSVKSVKISFLQHSLAWQGVAR